MFGVFTGITSIVLYHAKNSSYAEETMKMYGNNALRTKASLYAFTWFFVIFEFIASLATGQLVLFHLWLMRKGMTTLEYMVANKEDLF